MGRRSGKEKGEGGRWWRWRGERLQRRCVGVAARAKFARAQVSVAQKAPWRVIRALVHMHLFIL